MESAVPHYKGDAPYLLKSIDLEQYLPSVMDQNQTGSCTGHGTSSAIYALHKAAGNPLPYVPSPNGIYSLARSIVRADMTQRELLPPLQDNGTYPWAVMDVITRWGVRPMRGPNRHGHNSDCEVETINNEPILEDLVALNKVNVEQIEVGISLEERVAAIGIALMNKHIPCFGIMCDEQFLDWKPSMGPSGKPDPYRLAGGHWLCAYGYTTDPDTGEMLLKFRNSWGQDWGQDGNGIGNESFIASILNIRVLSLKP
jgi:hypothetical protein